MIYNVHGGFVDNPYSPDAHHVRVMTYNVGGWWKGSGDNVPADKDAAYYALQTGIIERNKPDIIGFQEYWSIFSKTGRTALSFLEQYYPYIHEENATDQYMGRCVCSKYPITNYTVRNFTNIPTRYYDSCTITINGVEVTFINTHLDVNSQDNRDEEILEILGLMKNCDLFIATGDYNTGINTPNKSSTAFVKNIKPYLDAGYNSANCTDFGFISTSSAIPDQDWNGCLDNVITSSGILITNAFVDTTKRTDGITEDRIDHMAFCADLQIYGSGILLGTDTKTWSD